MNTERRYHVYIMQSPSRRVLYIGVTSNIEKRVFEHKNHLVKGFSLAYDTTRLVHLEPCIDMRTAIDREKQLKRWGRTKKDVLIARSNPQWKDLAEDWGKQMHIDAHGHMHPLIEDHVC